MFLRYAIEGGQLKIWMLDRNELQRALEAKSFALAHTSIDGDTRLITADTPDIQSFLQKHAEDKRLFTPADLDRSKPRPAPV